MKRSKSIDDHPIGQATGAMLPGERPVADSILARIQLSGFNRGSVLKILAGKFPTIVPRHHDPALQ